MVIMEIIIIMTMIIMLSRKGGGRGTGSKRSEEKNIKKTKNDL